MTTTNPKSVWSRIKKRASDGTTTVRNFFWRLIALNMIIFGVRNAEKTMFMMRAYSGGWRVIAKTIWRNRKGIPTVKPSGTLNMLNGTTDGIHPGLQDVLDVAHRRLRDHYGAPTHPVIKRGGGHYDMSQVNDGNM